MQMQRLQQKRPQRRLQKYKMQIAEKKNTRGTPHGAPLSCEFSIEEIR